MNANSSGPKIVPAGHALSLFLAITFVICMVYGQFVPEEFRMYRAWAPFLPGFAWGTWTGFIIGLAETYAYGWYIAILFVPLYRYFASRA